MLERDWVELFGGKRQSRWYVDPLMFPPAFLIILWDIDWCRKPQRIHHMENILNVPAHGRVFS